jgi:hypothetical protein
MREVPERGAGKSRSLALSLLNCFFYVAKAAAPITMVMLFYVEKRKSTFQFSFINAAYILCTCPCL